MNGDEHEMTSREYVRAIDLLDAYSRWLEKHGYMDSDWYAEGNTVVEFLAEYKRRK